jgi:phosphoglycolate phosphatase
MGGARTETVVSGRALLFDLDGTLTDPRPGIVGCIRHALDRLGAPCPEDDVLARFIGPPLRRTFATLLATTDASRIEAAMGLYRERFGQSGLYENRVYDGIRAMLDEVRAVGPAAYVVTAKPTVYAERIVRHFALDHYFARVYGVELDGRFDDKADLLAHVLARERLPPDGAVMIGDRAADMMAARANGVRGIGVLWGYGSERELREAGADRLCAEPLALITCLAG